MTASPLSQPSLSPKADLPGWTYHASLQVHNNAATVLLSGYTVTFTIDSAALVTQGRLQADCDDLRITFNGGAELELDRLVSGCNTTATQVTFRTQESIDPITTDTRYTLYYGNPSAVTPPSNPSNIYTFVDDFQDGDANGWTVTKGTWAVVNDGGNFFYRYSGGGPNWPLTYAAVPLSDLDYTARIRATDSPITNWIGLAFRISDPSTLPDFLTFYQSRDQSIFKYGVVTNDMHTNPISSQPAFTMLAGSWYRLRVQAIGSTVRARIWADGAAEPTTWSLSTTTSTYQSSTNIGLTLYNHTTQADWDDIQVRSLVAVEPTVTVWWNTDYKYSRQVTVTNTSTSSSLPLKYSMRFTLDTAALVGSGQMQADCDDLRMVAAPGLLPVEIDRVVENCNTTQTVVWFALQRPVPASSQDQAYTLYYGNPTAGAPPANGMNVFLFFEDWEQGTTHWTNAGGLDAGNTGTMGTSTISSTASLSPSNSQYFVSRLSGGDAFSGFIPVAPSTGYAISVWAQTPSANVCVPIGFDPYTSAYVKGTETWLWTNNWPTPSAWSWRTGGFTTNSTTAFIKIKSELWNQCSGSPVYLDNIALQYSIGSEPTLLLGTEETILPAPVISNIVDIDPVNLGSVADVSADISTYTGTTITSATLQILSPVVVDVPMALTSGDATTGTWRANTYTPTQGGVYTYRVRAVASTGLTRLSAQQTFTVTDTAQPEITLISIAANPILVKNTQTLVVQVTDNGVLSSVTVTVDGTARPMTAIGGNQYSYSWQVTNVGTIAYTVTATDTSSNMATLTGSFISEPREVDICTWKDCRQGAASWSIDDGNSSCFAELNTAGIRGTYFYSGGSTQSWFATYSAVGHEIASHTVGHPCNPPACFPTCTEASLAALPIDPAVVSSYRTTQIEPNIAVIEAGTGKPVLSLAWPCGCSDPSRWAAAQSYMLGARGYYDWIAELTWLQDINLINPSNIWNLNTANSYDQTFIDRAYTEGKWATITSHGSCTGIDYMGQQNDNGHLWVAPIGDVLKYIYVRNASQLTNYVRASRTITFDAIHNLTTFQPLSITTPTPYTFLPIQYDNPVTLKVHIQDTDTVIGVTVDSNPVTYEVQTIEGTRYVTFDAALNSSRHVIVTLAAPAPAVSGLSETPDPVELGSSVTVSATVIPAEDTILAGVTLRVLSPEAHDYSMVHQTGNLYQFSFTPAQLGTYSYQVIAANTEGGSTQSITATFIVHDTTSPISQNRTQSFDVADNGTTNILSIEGYDLGRLAKVVLSTDESGTMQAFDWPVSDWWNRDWTYRRSVTITETASLARSAETVDLLFDSSTYYPALTSCNELRIAGADRIEVPIQVYGSLPNCHVLFQVSLAANANRTYYLYYGNPSAPTPSFTSDLTDTVAGSLHTITNAYFNLDLDTSATSGVISRMRLPQGTNTNLPLSTSSNAYWGWHHVCSSVDGNITGKASQCQGGTAQASGLSMVETLSGPLVREYTLTSVKAANTYTITYRFFANAPFYQYTLARTGTASLMNNFWYISAPENYIRLGAGMDGGVPYPYYNTYLNSSDYLRIVSSAAIAVGLIDGTDNDGTYLGGTAYNIPTASGLSLVVATGADSSAVSAVLARLAAPLSVSTYGGVETPPTATYGSPFEPDPGTGWVTITFTWNNPAIQNQLVNWRVTFYDVSGNIFTTPDMSFVVRDPTAVTLVSFAQQFLPGGVQLNWSTATEIGLLGFNLFRADELAGVKEKLNANLIPALSPGDLLGNAYQFTDVTAVSGKTYSYWVELVMLDGNQYSDPITVQVPYWSWLPITLR